MNDLSYHPIIPPAPENVSRPLWSVMISTYNCASYLRETLASVLAQDLGADIMQIVVIDDHFSDNKIIFPHTSKAIAHKVTSLNLLKHLLGVRTNIAITFRQVAQITDGDR
jgi:cellulose synthase/poly-beta-1,6-N-acetylglucosamine synthase-like glycosyltransferase